ncbi:MAG: response regulator [Pirellulaceae bacterium]|nr:response regulator [Pirellulaceae bacterium]
MSNTRILVVDDEPRDTRLLKEFLGPNGYVVREENDPTAALSAAEEFKPDLILLDVMMPEINGGQLAALFKANPKTKGVPILFLTATLTKEEADLCGGRIGKYRFLAKPIVLTEVLASVQHHLRSAR